MRVSPLEILLELVFDYENMTLLDVFDMYAHVFLSYSVGLLEGHVYTSRSSTDKPKPCNNHISQSHATASLSLIYGFLFVGTVETAGKFGTYICLYQIFYRYYHVDPYMGLMTQAQIPTCHLLIV